MLSLKDSYEPYASDARKVRPKTVPPRREQQNTLTTYFREMSSFSLLSADDEVRLAKQLEDAERAAWVALLTYPSATAFVLSEIAPHIDGSCDGVERVRAAAERAAKSRRKSDLAALETAARDLFPVLRAIDGSNDVRSDLGRHLALLSRGPSSRPLAFLPKSKSFKEHVLTIEQCERRVVRCRNRFAQSNLGLVVSIARRYGRSGMPLADLIQEGNIGLLTAVERFDHSRGFRFSTYATWWIRHSIGRALADKGRTVRVPVHRQASQKRVRKAEAKLAHSLGRPPTVAELAEATDLPEKKITTIQGRGQEQIVSLDAPLGDTTRERLEAFQVEGADDRSIVDQLVTESVYNHVDGVLHRLSPMEQDVLRRRYGLRQEAEETLQEIGRSHGLSRERIRQIQHQALDKIRTVLRQDNEL